MSVSVFINGVRDPDGKLGDMLDLKASCDKLDIDYPEELKQYFKGTYALSFGDRKDSIREATEISLDDIEIDGLLSGNDPCYGNGIVIDLSKLPKDIKKLRIGMS